MESFTQPKQTFQRQQGGVDHVVRVYRRERDRLRRWCASHHTSFKEAIAQQVLPARSFLAASKALGWTIRRFSPYIPASLLPAVGKSHQVKPDRRVSQIESERPTKPVGPSVGAQVGTGIYAELKALAVAVPCELRPIVVRKENLDSIRDLARPLLEPLELQVRQLKEEVARLKAELEAKRVTLLGEKAPPVVKPLPPLDLSTLSESTRRAILESQAVLAKLERTVSGSSRPQCSPDLPPLRVQPVPVVEEKEVKLPPLPADLDPDRPRSRFTPAADIAALQKSTIAAQSSNQSALDKVDQLLRVLKAPVGSVPLPKARGRRPPSLRCPVCGVHSPSGLTCYDCTPPTRSIPYHREREITRIIRALPVWDQNRFDPTVHSKPPGFTYGWEFDLEDLDQATIDIVLAKLDRVHRLQKSKGSGRK